MFLHYKLKSVKKCNMGKQQCLPKMLKSTFFEKFSSWSVTPKTTAE